MNFLLHFFTHCDINIYEEVKIVFADMLKKLRTEKGWTQQELAKRARVSKSTISMLETGERKPSFQVLETLADIFNVNLDTFSETERTDEVDALRQTLRENRELRMLLSASQKLNKDDLMQLTRIATLMDKE